MSSFSTCNSNKCTGASRGLSWNYIYELILIFRNYLIWWSGPKSSPIFKRKSHMQHNCKLDDHGTGLLMWNKICSNFDTISSGFNRLFDIPNPPFPKHSGELVQMRRLSLDLPLDTKFQPFSLEPHEACVLAWAIFSAFQIDTLRTIPWSEYQYLRIALFDQIIHIFQKFGTFTAH